MKSKVKMGVVGVGSLGQWHARVYSELDNVDLVGIYDRDPHRASEIAERYKTRVFDSMESLAEAADAASIVVPTNHHFAVGKIFIERNCHLLVEKPIADTMQDAEAMVALARENNVLLQVGHVERFNPVMKHLETVLDHPRFIEAVRLAPFPPPREGLPPRGTEVSVVLDLMIHDLEIILHLVRSPVRDIHAVGVPVLSQSEDIANVRLGFENGCVANISASRISMERTRKIRVFQTDAYLSLDYQNQTGIMHRKAGGKIESSQIPIDKGDPLFNELSSFANCVLTRNDPVVTGAHASQALQLAVTICQHIREGGS